MKFQSRVQENIYKAGINRGLSRAEMIRARYETNPERRANCVRSARFYHAIAMSHLNYAKAGL